MQHPILSIIGAGGKTTALLALARALAGQRVLLTTSTHIYPVAPPQSRALLIDPDADELLDALRIPGVHRLIALCLEQAGKILTYRLFLLPDGQRSGHLAHPRHCLRWY